MESHWELSFIIPGFICIGVGIAVFFLLIPSKVSFLFNLKGLLIKCWEIEPHSVGLHVDFLSNNDEEIKDSTHDKHNKNSSKDSLESQVVEHGEEAITIWKAMLIPVSWFKGCKETPSNSFFSLSLSSSSGRHRIFRMSILCQVG